MYKVTEYVDHKIEQDDDRFLARQKDKLKKIVKCSEVPLFLVYLYLSVISKYLHV